MTGETRESPALDTPEAAEAAFYGAFSRGDLATMMALWKPDDTVVCLHPGDVRREGQGAVRQGWAEILTPNREGFLIVPVDVRRVCHGDISVHTLRELLWFDGQLRGAMLATNVYVHTEQGWRIWLHQAAPDPMGRAFSGEGQAQRH